MALDPSDRDVEMTQAGMTRPKSLLRQLLLHRRIRSRVIQPRLAMPTLSVLAFLAPLIVYIRTLAPAVYPFDSAELVTGSHVLGIIHAPGYPLYLILGKLFSLLPIGNVAYRMNLMSAVFGAATSVTTFLVLVELTRRRFISLAGTFALAFSYYFWQEAVLAEVYTLETFMIALLLLVLLKWRPVPSRNKLLLLFASLFGLSLGNRITIVLFLPAIAWYVLAETRGRVLKDAKMLVLMFVASLLGLCIYLYLPLRYLADPPLNYATLYEVNLATPGGVWWMMSGQMYRFFALGYGLTESLRELAYYLGQLWRNFLGIGVLVGLLGWVRLWRDSHRKFVLVFLSFVFSVVFFVNYRVVDKETMFLPSYLLWTVALVHGYAAIADLCERCLDHLSPEKTRIRAASIVMTTALVIGASGGILNWRWTDRSDDTYAEAFARQVLSSVPANSLIVADWCPAVVLEYSQLVEGNRPDVVIFNRSRFEVAQYYRYWNLGLEKEDIFELVAQQEFDFLSRHAAGRPLYLVESHLGSSEPYDVYTLFLLLRLSER